MQLLKGSRYTRISSISDFCICKHYTQGSEYAWSMFHRVLNKPLVLNMPGLRIWHNCEYVRVTQGTEYA